MQEELMLTRRRRTLSSISNYIPLHIILNQPAGVTFSITVPKSFTIEQLARQIEAEYAFLVEREVGHSRYPVIECGALFDHIELDRSLSSVVRRSGRHQQQRESLQQKEEKKEGEDEEEEDAPDGEGNKVEAYMDEREEAESRGVQLRFSDKVEDVLDRNSTVHVVNIDQGVGMGRKLSLTNLTGDQDVFLNDPVATLGLSSSPTTPPLHMDTPTSISVAAATNSNHPLSTTTTYPTESDPVRTSATLALSATHNPPTYSSEGSGSLDRCHPLSPSTFPIDISGSEPAVKPRATHLHGSNPRASTLTTDTASTLLASPFVSSNSLSSILHGDDQFTQSSSITTTAATTTTTTAAAETCTTIRSSAINTTGNLSTSAHLDVAENGAGAWRPFSVCSTATDTTTTTTGNDGTGDSKANNPRYSTSRQRSRATDILLNLEASSNDGRFQEILHNTIALDHFRQFCFQEYSIENLLFWMDVELFAKPSEELLQMGSRNKRQEMDEKHFNEYEGHAGVKTGDVHKSLEGEEDPEQFAVQHARYIYLTYIDSCGPLQVNLSDESRTDIPWPILDYQSEGISIPPLASSSLPVEKRRSYLWGLGSRDQKKEGKDIEGWPLDRRMFDGAQEHTYQLMKGHTLVRFEESDLWKAVEKIKKEQPEEYARAMIRGPLNTYYRPDKSLILSTVKRSRSRHPAAKPQTLYNWNNSTSDLDRSKDKEEALAMTMSQYFGPIPASVRRPGRVILGLGSLEDEDEDEFEDCDEFDTYADGRRRAPSAGNGKTSSVGSSYTSKKARFAKRLSGSFMGRSNKRLSQASEETMGVYQELDVENDVVEIDSKNGKRTTRWMVDGYFNDQVRLTAAQRKRLLRRNNKLTKFFGSRVDGTLRPVEEIEGIDASVGRFEGPNSAPSVGSPLAYALSSSTIHDMDKKYKKKLDGGSLSLRSRRSASDRGSETLALLAGATSNTGATNTTNARPRSVNLLQRFRRSSPDVGESSSNSNSSCNGGYRTFDSFTQPLHPSDGPRSSANSTRGSLFKRSGSNKVRDGGHLRSMTVTEVQPVRMLAHPHPLWSGSFSDQEGNSSAYERRRGLSITSMLGNAGNNGALTPTTPTSSCAMRSATDQGGSGVSQDRQAMSSRRKKADKLSTFFGAQLTKRELSSQLPMEDEDDLTEVQGVPKLQSVQRSSDQINQQPQNVTGPIYSSVNQLSHRQRSILWRRNKKLRGLLGVSLPESEVATAITKPVLMGPSSPQSRVPGGQGRMNLGAKAQRRKRQGSKQGLQQGDDSTEDGQDDENSEDCGLDGSICVSVTNSNTSGRGKGRTVKRSGVVVRTRRPSNVSMSSSRKSFSRSVRVHPGLVRVTSDHSLRSFRTIDSLVTCGAGGSYDEDEYLSSTPSSPRRRKHSSRPGSGPGSPIARTSRDATTTGQTSRFHHKKKVDKIHQFMGDRVPEQDLWMGTIGREKTQEMLDMNLLSPTSSLGSGTNSLAAALSKHSPSGWRSKTNDRNRGLAAVDLREGGNGGSKSAPNIYGDVDMGGVKLERSLSDPPKRLRSRLRLDGSIEYPQQQQGSSVRRSFSTTNRLRLQLAIPTPPTLTGTRDGISGIGQLLFEDTNMNVSKYCDNVYSSPSSGPSSPLSTSATTGGRGLLILDDDSNDESSQILPLLRTMSGEDQERFLKRAEKLEKYFGQFPPSSLLESSLTTSSVEDSSEMLERYRETQGELTPGAHAEDVEEKEERPRSSRHRSLVELAGLLTRSDSRSSSSDSTSSGWFGVDRKTKAQKRMSLRSSEEAIEPLRIPDTQFCVDL